MGPDTYRVLTLPKDIFSRLRLSPTKAFPTKGVCLTKEDIDNALIEATVQYHRFPGTTATVCAITLVNSFTTFIGTSDCIDPLNFSQTRGEQEALNKAKSALADHLAVALKESLCPGLYTSLLTD